MDPASIIHSTLLVVKTIDRLRTSCNESSATLLTIEVECGAMANIVEVIRDWLETTPPDSSGRKPAMKASLANVLSVVDKSMKRLNDDLGVVRVEGKGPLGLAVPWTTAKYVWKEDLMRKHLAELRQNANLLTLYLKVITL